ncbi:hypothetical protein AN401_11720 [Zobellella denitrificans]|uniref:DUF1320 domain-containing protein n=1 Tax=Zobellella denitrificans TaxID=347534 RepID=A0A291HQQ0_9GAMM|nr:phage protein Gp36 family protein [Zobellella denitrificans]ATG74439.1 hypothetical protein AN401_11720 [Zobellella denitrificans]
MSYADLAEMQARYGADELATLTSRDFSGQLNEAVLAEALSDAQATIDGYLASRYRLPLAAVPVVLTRICCVLARYYLEQGRATDQARQDYEDAVRWLEQVARGVVSLGLTEQGTQPAGDNGAQLVSAGSVFGRQRSKGFI